MQETLSRSKTDKTVKPWTTPALENWSFIKTEDSDSYHWEKQPSVDKKTKETTIVRLPEATVGPVELELAGRRVVETYLGKDEWKKVPTRVMTGEVTIPRTPVVPKKKGFFK